MSLDFFAEPMDRIRQFLQSRELTVLIIRHDPDLDQILQKFLLALDQDEENPAVLVGVQAAYHDPVSFATDVLRDLVEHNEVQRQPLASMGIQLPRPGVPSGAGGPAEDAAAVLSAYVSDVADGLPGWAGAYGVVLRPKEITDVTGYRNFVRFLAESTRSEWAKYLVSDRRVRPLLDGLPQECARVSVQDFALSPEEIEHRVQAELAGGKLDAKQTRLYSSLTAAFAFSKKDYAQAALAQEEVLRKCREEGVASEEAQALYNLGNTYAASHRYQQAEETLARAVEVASAEEMHALASMALTNLGVTLQRLGRIEESLAAFQAARSMFRSLQHRPGEIHVLDSHAAVLALAGRNDEADAVWREALTLCDSMTAPHLNRLRDSARRDILARMRRFYESTQQLERIQTLDKQE